MYNYDYEFNITEMVLLITAKTIYVLDRNGEMKTRYSLEDLMEVIMVKSNPCFFALSFKEGIPLVMQSFRRAELVIFMLSHQTADKKAKIRVGDALKVRMRSGKTHVI